MHLVPSTDFPLIVSRAILTLCLSRRVTIERPPPPPGRHLVGLLMLRYRGQPLLSQVLTLTN